MSGFEQLNSHQKAAITALLAGKTKRDAATEAGVNERTLRRWFSDDEAFRQTYRSLCDAAFLDALSALKQRVEAAVAVLTDALESSESSTRLRAADKTIAHALKAYEHLEVSERLREVEQYMKELEERKGRDNE